MIRTITLVAMLSMAACAKPASQIGPAPVSSLRYSDATCPDLYDEQRSLRHKVDALSSSQNERAAADAVGVAVGLFLFAPLVLVPAFTGDDEQQLAQARGELEAIDMAINRNC